MFNPRQTIIIQGREEKLLLSLGMWVIAKERKIDLKVKDVNDINEVLCIYVKIIYLAYLNALEKNDIDTGKNHKKSNEFSLADFEIWATNEDIENFNYLVGQIFEMRTGKTLEEVREEKTDKKKL
jgi:hypothetical protein